jgi:glycosyltransferase involved in cell wall biosynthesis/SAM-dependent methyltransferase
MNACTIISRNYLAQARVLGESFCAYHPSGTFTTLILDPGNLALENEPFRAFTLNQIGLDNRECERMAAIYDVMEMATAVKPWFMRTLLAESGEPILYLDPDIQIFAPLDEFVELVQESSIVLTPHQIEPPDYDPESVAESSVRLAGVFNLGFLGLAPGTDDFLDWWSERLSRDCVIAPDRGIFVDQRWFDFVPAQFDHFVVRDPTLNVAWWNLHERTFSSNGAGWLVEGRPLKFFHFSGYDPREPHVLSKFQGPKPRILLSEHAELAQICAAYRRQLLDHGFDVAIAQPYGFDSLPSGLPYDSLMRRLYRLELLRAEECGDPEPPNPFTNPDDFLDWLREPLDRAGQAGRISRYLQRLYAERPDLQERFRDVRWLAGNRFVEWVATEGRFEANIPAELVPETRPVDAADAEAEAEPEPQRPTPGGLNVAGYFRAEAGVGEAARQIVAAVRVAGTPFSTYTYEATISRQEHEPLPEAGRVPEYDTNLICVNADQLPSFTWDAGPAFFRDHYSIGVWWWEVAEFPAWLHPAFEIVREIWVGSRHVADAISAETDQPVLVFPLPVDVPPAPRLSRADLGLPDDFLFLFSFDFLSVVERKNPLGLIEAFSKAFEPGEGPILVVKSINGDKKLTELERLRAAAADRPDVRILDRYLSADEKNALMAASDCYVSLHRSEGFGLTLAESMAYGKPAIATAYSGNLDFMNEENSYLVPFETVKIGPGADPYPEDGTWADPDLEQAAELMRRVYESPDEARQRGERGRTEIRENRSVERAAEFIRSRLQEIEQLREDPPIAPVPVDLPTAPASEIDHAWTFLAEGPSLPLRSPSRFGRFGIFARRILFRVLRPYMIRQREWEVAVVNALRQVDERAEALSTTKADDAKQRSTDLVTRATGAFERRLRNHAAEVVAAREHLDRLESEHAAERLAALEGDLFARPYVERSSELVTHDPAGRLTMGYADGVPPRSVDFYRSFEDVFRGPETFIAERQRRYIELLRGHAPVLDIGCGRGELLDLLREAGIEARGIDLDAGMVARSREKGHYVEQADAIDYLKGLDDGLVGALVGLQMIEHLPYSSLLRFFELALAKLRPGGILLVETVNPHALPAFKTFSVDLSHVAPIFPEVAVVLCRLTGFDSAYVLFPNGAGDLEEDRKRDGEYALVASRRS